MTEQELANLTAEHAAKLEAWNTGVEQIMTKLGQLSHEYAAAAEAGRRASQIAAQLSAEGADLKKPLDCREDLYRYLTGPGAGRFRRAWLAAGAPKHDAYDQAQAAGGA